MILNIRTEYHIFFFGHLIFLFYLLNGTALAGNLYHVKWVIDGDTIVLEDGRHVRYIGINSPEIDHKNQMAEPYGNTARDFNKKLISARPVQMEFDEERVDQYGRLLAYVYLPDNTCLNMEILRSGYAYCLPKKPNKTYENKLLKAQQYAMQARLGIWKSLKEKEGRYTGNIESKRFHHPTCSFGMRIKKSNIIIFSKKWGAFCAGFAPCKKCMPK